LWPIGGHGDHHRFTPDAARRKAPTAHVFERDREPCREAARSTLTGIAITPATGSASQYPVSPFYPDGRTEWTSEVIGQVINGPAKHCSEGP